MSSNPFAALADYPASGPAVPDRQKVIRNKNKHESGTGRTDRVKREGRGAANVGNFHDDIKYPAEIDAKKEAESAPAPAAESEEPAAPKQVYVPASNFFSDSGDEVAAQPVHHGKPVVNVPAEFADMMAKKDIEVHAVKAESHAESEQFETGFLSTQEALKQRAEHSFHNDHRGGHGAPRGGAHRGDHPRPARDEAKEHPFAKYAAKDAKDAKEAKPAGEDKPQRNASRDQQHHPRDQRNSGVQHQRQAANPHSERPGKLDIQNFPALGSH